MRNTLLYALVLTMASISFTGCNSFEEPHAEGAENPHSSEEHEHAEEAHAEGEHHAAHKIIVTSPVEQDVTLTQQYVCQVHSCRHIEVRALEGGYLEEIKVNEGQTVKQGDMMFKILPVVLQAKLDVDVAEAQLAEIELKNTQKLFEQEIESDQAVAMSQAKLAKAKATVSLAQAELNFTDLKAPFNGIIDRLHEQQGSLIEEGDVLTTLSDNSVMWVYFNVSEARYLEYQASLNQRGASDADGHETLQIELKLANHTIFPEIGKIGAIEADFNNETGNIAFRADFPNPNSLLRHGQTGTVLIHRVEKNALVIPQRATFEILAKKYVYVIGEDNIVRQREIVIQNEQPDVFIIEKGLDPSEKIVLEGVRQVRDGDKVEYEFHNPEDVLANLKYHAE